MTVLSKVENIAGAAAKMSKKSAASTYIMVREILPTCIR